MKRLVIKCGTACILMLGCWYSMTLFSYFLRSITHYNLDVDSRIATFEQEAIIASIKEWGSRNSFDSSLRSHLFNSFPYIDVFTARLRSDGKLYCSITAQNPEWHINESLLLLADKSIVQASCYRDSILRELPTLSIVQAENIYELVPVISCIPQQLAQAYVLTIYHGNNIVLVDRRDLNFSIRLDQKTVKQFSPDLCNRIKEDLIERKLLSSERHWVVDARFNNQLVVRSGKGVEK